MGRHHHEKIAQESEALLCLMAARVPRLLGCNGCRSCLWLWQILRPSDVVSTSRLATSAFLGAASRALVARVAVRPCPPNALRHGQLCLGLLPNWRWRCWPRRKICFSL